MIEFCFCTDLLGFDYSQCAALRERIALSHLLIRSSHRGLSTTWPLGGNGKPSSAAFPYPFLLNCSLYWSFIKSACVFEEVCSPVSPRTLCDGSRRYLLAV